MQQHEINHFFRPIHTDMDIPDSDIETGQRDNRGMSTM